MWKRVDVRCRCSPDWQMKLRCWSQERAAHQWGSPTSMLPQGLECRRGLEWWDQWLKIMESPDIQNQISPITYLPNTECRSYRCFSFFLPVGWNVKNMKISCWRCSFRLKTKKGKKIKRLTFKKNHFNEMFILGAVSCLQSIHVYQQCK